MSFPDHDHRANSAYTRAELVRFVRNTLLIAALGCSGLTLASPVIASLAGCEGPYNAHINGGAPLAVGLNCGEDPAHSVVYNIQLFPRDLSGEQLTLLRWGRLTFEGSSNPTSIDVQEFP